jgi:hypothetical protein
MGKLTEAKVRTAKATDKEQWLNDGDGLYLRIHKSGSKVWIIRRKQFGKTQIITLDPYPTMQLKHPCMGISKDITHTHECPIAIKVRESKPGIVNDLNNAGTTTLERAVARSVVIASG